MRVERGKPEEYEKFSTRPVPIRPFDADSKRAALVYGARLNERLASTGVAAELHGSLVLEIAGKGEWEFALYPSPDQWYPTLTLLINHFRGVYLLSEELVMFNDLCDGHNVEVIAMRGNAAECNRAIMRYWREHPAAAAIYEAEKYRHAHSKRDYYRWKGGFIADILESL
ncbi:MAG TPA: hypothetical protein VIL85_21820 [Thermomicrobiales bacterium]|jgi:hypothetical protein